MPVLVPSRAALCAILMLSIAAMAGAGSTAQAAEATIRVNTFPNAKALPVYVTIRTHASANGRPPIGAARPRWR